MAPQRTGARAGRIDENAVELAVQPPHALVLFAPDRDRMNVRETGAAHAGSETREALFIHVKGVEAPRRAHESAQRKGLSARACAEVAAAGREKARDELRALILHVNKAVLVNRPAGEAGLRRKTNAVGRKRRRKRFNAVLFEFGEHFLARRLEEIHAKVKGSAFRHRAVEVLRIRILRLNQIKHPLRKLGAHVRGRLGSIKSEDILQGAFLGSDGGGRNRFDAVLARENGKSRELRSTIRMDRAHGGAQRAVAAKRIVDAFGDDAAVAHAELRVALEEELHEHVGRAVKLKDHLERAGELVNDQRRHADAAGLAGRHAVFRGLRAGFLHEPFAGAFLAAALIGGNLAFRAAAARFGAFRTAGLLHFKGTTPGMIFRHVLSRSNERLQRSLFKALS